MVVQPQRRLFTVDEYYRMAEAGVLHPDDRVELIEGEIIQMAAIGSHHASVVSRLNRLFTTGVGEGAIVRVQDPVRLSDLSEPEPDVALLHPKDDYYAGGHPSPADVYLLVEVADTTLGFDRDRKMPLYARSGIRECWLIDIEHRTVTTYRNPSTDGYQHTQTLEEGSIAPLAFPEQAFAIEEILGR